MKRLPVVLPLLFLSTLSGCINAPVVVQSGCQVDRSLIVKLDNRKPKGKKVPVPEIMDKILPAIVDDIKRDNDRKEKLHKQLDQCGV